MPPEKNDGEYDSTDSTPTPGRRVVFPWVWIVLFVAARVGLGFYNQSADLFADDELNVMTVMGGHVMLIGVALWYVVRGRLYWPLRLIPLVIVAAAPFAMAIFFRMDFDGNMRIRRIALRHAEKADEQLEELQPVLATKGILDWTETEQDYPRFLGAGAWPEAHGVQLATDWENNPPELLWRQPIGAGWSSFALVGDYAITQEQRGPEELVTCYRASTGESIWVHADQTRFDPDEFGGGIGGHGPRATPTVFEQKVFTHGATGLLNCLDALTGKVLWSHDLHAEFDAQTLLWGNAASPLVVADERLVVIGPGARPEVKETDGHNASLVAFDLDTGEVRWTAGWRITSYVSPVLAELGGVRTILQINQDALTAHAVEDGRVLWEYPWPGRSDADANVSQPIPLGNDKVYLCKGYGVGSSLLQVEASDDGPSAKPLWSPPVKPVMKTKFTNVVVRDGHVYGLDAGLLQCIEIATGKSDWKKRRRPSIGHGQLILVGEHLLILSEHGELILVQATPERYNEHANLQALDSDLITWNNPALSGDLLLVRNAEEAAAYRLPTESPTE